MLPTNICPCQMLPAVSYHRQTTDEFIDRITHVVPLVAARDICSATMSKSSRSLRDAFESAATTSDDTLAVFSSHIRTKLMPLVPSNIRAVCTSAGLIATAMESFERRAGGWNEAELPTKRNACTLPQLGAAFTEILRQNLDARVIEAVGPTASKRARQSHKQLTHDLHMSNTSTKMTADMLTDSFCFVFGDRSPAAPLAVDECVQYIQGSCAEFLGSSVCVQADVLNLHLSALLVGGMFEGSIAFAKVFMLSDVMSEIVGESLAMLLRRRLHDYDWALPERSINDNVSLSDLAAEVVAVRRELLFARASVASGSMLFTEEVGGVLCVAGGGSALAGASTRLGNNKLAVSSHTGVARGRRNAVEASEGWERLRRLMWILSCLRELLPNTWMR